MKGSEHNRFFSASICAWDVQKNLKGSVLRMNWMPHAKVDVVQRKTIIPPKVRHKTVMLSALQLQTSFFIEWSLVWFHKEGNA